MADPDPKQQLLQAIKPHVPFDGWSEEAFRAAILESGVDDRTARVACPRGAVDLALAFHAAGDAELTEQLGGEDLSEMRFRDRVAHAVRLRLEAIEDRELVRRGTALFSLPIYAADGAKAIWGTADTIWTALGDSSEDINWYTKRATLSGVYGATVLYWLGDDSPGHEETWGFLDRRIDDVMQIEGVKARLRENKLFSQLMAGPLSVLGRIKAPSGAQQAGMPGRWSGPVSGGK